MPDYYYPPDEKPSFKYDVKVPPAPASRDSGPDLGNVPLVLAPAADGSPRVVRLSQVADVSPSTGPNQVNRRDLSRETNIDGNALGRSSGDIVADINKFSNNVMAQQLFLTFSSQEQGRGTIEGSRQRLQYSRRIARRSKVRPIRSRRSKPSSKVGTFTCASP